MTDSATKSTMGHRLKNGYGALLVGVILLIFTIYIVYGIITMEVPESAQAPGPKLFPSLLAVFSFIITVWLVIDVLRHPHTTGETVYLPPVGETATESNVPTSPIHDFKSLGIAIVGFSLFVLLLQPVGWIISAALLFWVFCYALGSNRLVFNLAVGIAFAATIQAAFSAGLGLTLPPGILEGLF